MFVAALLAGELLEGDLPPGPERGDQCQESGFEHRRGMLCLAPGNRNGEKADGVFGRDSDLRTLKPLRVVLIVLFGAVTLLGCSGDAGDLSTPPTVGTVPIVGGIWVTDETGNVSGPAGNPDEGGLRAHPNPTVYNTTFSLTLPVQSNVIVWAVRAIGPGESRATDLPMFGGIVDTAYRKPVWTFQARAWPAGVHEVRWDVQPDLGGRVPVGMYRVYASINGAVTYVDVLFVDPSAPLPSWIPCWASGTPCDK
jgi:hypothetical protein